MPTNKGTTVGNTLINPVEYGRSTIVVRLSGDLDDSTVPGLRRTLIDVIMRRRPARIVIDVREVTEIDSVAIGTLRAACDMASDAHLVVGVRAGRSPVVDRLTAADLPLSA